MMRKTNHKQNNSDDTFQKKNLGKENTVATLNK